MKFFRPFALCIALVAPAFAGAPALVVGPWAAAQYEQGFSIHGIAGDTKLLFALQVSDVPGHARGAYVSDRSTGRQLGALLPPARGWSAPLTAKLIGFTADDDAVAGRLLILDGIQPHQVGTGVPSILYEISYSHSQAAGLASAVTGAHPLPAYTGVDALGMPNGLVYPGSFTALPGGGVAAVDMITGGVWVAGPSLDDWRMALIDPRFSSGPGREIAGIGRAPGGGTRPYRFLPPSPGGGAPSFPGAHSITYAAATDEVVVLVTCTPGGLFALPRLALLDRLVPAFAKGALLRELVPPTPGLADLAVGLDYDRFHPRTPWVYWQRVTSTAAEGFNVMRRVHLRTGEIQVVASSVQLYDWTNDISVLPPRGPHEDPFTSITSANMQEQNNPASNVLLNGVPAFVGPSIVPIVAVSNW
jgi:hypothetical protein